MLASRSEYFWKSEQFHFILAINVLFRDLDLNLAALGEILICSQHTWLVGKPSWRDVLIASRPSLTEATCQRHGPSISSLTTQLRLHYALNIDSDLFSQKVSALLALRAWQTPRNITEWRLWCSMCTRSWPCFDTCSVAV